MEIVWAKYLITMQDDDIIENGAIAVEFDKIIDVGKKEELLNKYPDTEKKEFPNSVLMPGLINSHCHLELTEPLIARNLNISEELTSPEYVEWLVKTLDYVGEAKKEELIQRTQDGISNLINSGHTTIGNMAFYEGALNILYEVGIRSVLFLQIASGYNIDAQDSFETAIGIAEEYLNKSDDLMQVGLGPYASYLLSRPLLKNGWLKMS